MKVIAQFTFSVSMEVKDRDNDIEIAQTARSILQELISSDDIADNITKKVDIREDSFVDVVSDDIENN